MEGTDSCSGDILPPELIARIVHILSPNEVACTCRLINKTTAKQFNGCISVRLSQPVPRHAFARRWGDDRGIHGLTLEQRQKLLCLTARSGDIANLEVALAVVGCGLTNQFLNAAAEGGHLAICVWLRDRGCPCNVWEVIRRAVRAGHTEVVRWALAQPPGLAGDALAAAAGAGQRALCEEILPLVLLAAGSARAISTAACEAAEGGHVELTEWLLGQLVEPGDITDGELLLSAAGGFELPALQRLYQSRLGSSEASALAEFIETHGARLAAAALTSPTPDWRAKLEWLEAVGCRLGRNQDESCDVITKCGDAVERLTLLRERGFTVDIGRCLYWAVANANLTVVRYLRSQGLPPGAVGFRVVEIAMEVGDLALLAELLEAGGTVRLKGVYEAAYRGHLHLLRWLEGPEAGPAAAAALQEALQEDATLAVRGVKYGGLELMEWLRERGCPMDEEAVFIAAAGAGNTAILERLVAWGCPMSRDAYLAAGRNGDLATLRYLRRLGCPWGPDTFDEAVHIFDRGCSLEVLHWLVAEGCPVDWESAGVQSRLVGDAGVVAWIESHIPQA